MGTLSSPIPLFRGFRGYGPGLNPLKWLGGDAPHSTGCLREDVLVWCQHIFTVSPNKPQVPGLQCTSSQRDHRSGFYTDIFSLSLHTGHAVSHFLAVM